MKHDYIGEFEIVDDHRGQPDQSRYQGSWKVEQQSRFWYTLHLVKNKLDSSTKVENRKLIVSNFLNLLDFFLLKLFEITWIFHQTFQADFYTASKTIGYFCNFLGDFMKKGQQQWLTNAANAV